MQLRRKHGEEPLRDELQVESEISTTVPLASSESSPQGQHNDSQTLTAQSGIIDANTIPHGHRQTNTKLHNHEPIGFNRDCASRASLGIFFKSYVSIYIFHTSAKRDGHTNKYISLFSMLQCILFGIAYRCLKR